MRIYIILRKETTLHWKTMAWPPECGIKTKKVDYEEEGERNREREGDGKRNENDVHKHTESPYLTRKQNIQSYLP